MACGVGGGQDDAPTGRQAGLRNLPPERIRDESCLGLICGKDPKHIEGAIIPTYLVN